MFKPKTKLINLKYSELEKILKQIAEKFNKSIRKLNSLTSGQTQKSVHFFKTLERNKYSFMKPDVVALYNS